MIDRALTQSDIDDLFDVARDLFRDDVLIPITDDPQVRLVTVKTFDGVRNDDPWVVVAMAANDAHGTEYRGFFRLTQLPDQTRPTIVPFGDWLSEPTR